MQPNWNPWKATINFFIKQKKKPKKTQLQQKKLCLNASENFFSCWVLNLTHQLKTKPDQSYGDLLQRNQKLQLNGRCTNNRAINYILTPMVLLGAISPIVSAGLSAGSWKRSFITGKPVNVKSSLLLCSGRAALLALSRQQKLHWSVNVAGVPCHIQPISYTLLFLLYLTGI